MWLAVSDGVGKNDMNEVVPTMSHAKSGRNTADDDYE